MSDDMSMSLPSSAGEHGVLRSMQEVAMSSQEASKMLRTYNIAWWGNNYYDVNELGHISVCPSFWPGDNSSLLAALQNVLRQEHSGYIYLWAREGAGRSHLLHAACAELSQRGDAVGYVPLDKRTWFVPEVLDGMEQLSLVCIDNKIHYLGSG